MGTFLWLYAGTMAAATVASTESPFVTDCDGNGKEAGCCQTEAAREKCSPAHATAFRRGYSALPVS